MNTKDRGRQIGDRVVIIRPGHPWEGFSGVIDDFTPDNPYIHFGVMLDNGMRAGCKSSDVKSLGGGDGTVKP